MRRHTVGTGAWIVAVNWMRFADDVQDSVGGWL